MPLVLAPLECHSRPASVARSPETCPEATETTLFHYKALLRLTEVRKGQRDAFVYREQNGTRPSATERRRPPRIYLVMRFHEISSTQMIPGVRGRVGGCTQGERHPTTATTLVSLVSALASSSRRTRRKRVKQRDAAFLAHPVSSWSLYAPVNAHSPTY